MSRHHAGSDAPGAHGRIWIPPVTLTDMREDAMHVLLWQVRGAMDVTIAGHSRRVDAGHGLWIPAGIPHDIVVHADSVMTPLFFEVAGTATTLRQPTTVAVDRELRTVLLAYNASWQTAIQHSVDLGRQILALIEERPVLQVALPMPESRPAQLVAETLRFNPGDTRSVEELAESAHTSTRSIESAFRAETGMTLRQWRIRNRMENAAILLRAHAGVDAVLSRVGYTNVNAFRRVFHGHFGMSPTVYAQRYAAR